MIMMTLHSLSFMVPHTRVTALSSYSLFVSLLLGEHQNLYQLVFVRLNIILSLWDWWEKHTISSRRGKQHNKGYFAPKWKSPHRRTVLKYFYKPVPNFPYCAKFPLYLVLVNFDNNIRNIRLISPCRYEIDDMNIQTVVQRFTRTCARSGFVFFFCCHLSGRVLFLS